MQRTTLSGVLLGLLLLCCGGILVASESEELRERAKALRREASLVAERGNTEQAERLERESLILLEAAERLEFNARGRGEEENHPDIDRQVRHLQDRRQDLLAKERQL